MDRVVRLNHPNLITVNNKELNESSTKCVIEMEHCQYGDLSYIINYMNSMNKKFDQKVKFNIKSGYIQNFLSSMFSRTVHTQRL